MCKKSMDLNCMKQLADHEVMLNFVAAKLQDIMLLMMMMMVMVTITITTRTIIIMFVLQFLLPDGWRVSHAA